ncbi:MAG: SH3 domain-containing protein [bacterium]|nr:SH3 domain-containing protein [bacterium]
MEPLFHKEENTQDAPKQEESLEKKKDLEKLRRAKRRQLLAEYYIAGAVLGVLLLALLGFGLWKWTHRQSRQTGEMGVQTTEAGTESNPEATEATEDEEAAASAAAIDLQAEKQAVVDAYTNLGLIQAESYVNLREEASTTGDVIGKMYANSACEILEEQEGWYQISSGGLTGYVSAEYVLTGEEAREAALPLVEEYAIVQADALNIRTEPSTDAPTLGQAYEGERYRAVRVEDGWVFNGSGYLSADYVTIQLALNEARKLDLRSMVINLYDNPAVSNVQGYLNIRNKPSEKDGKIIGKMPGNCGAEILETLDGWYRIQSGPVTGYVSAEYVLTGAAAKQAAIDHAELMAIVSTDRLNARTEPSTEASIWTQISNNERYSVVSQTDGWVEIELDTETAFVSTDYVDVRYAIPEAIKFTPLESGSSGGSGSGASSRRTQIVNYAMQFLGNPYVWGGTSLTRGVDCSGFTMQVMRQFGVNLPHYSGSQANSGKRISSSEMRPGDLIFYTNKGGTINHVSMYIGNGQVIHAASKRSGIKISSWNYRTPARIVNVLGD